mmetsp:Transcript_116922/g.261421  ORF Transcript_116922/g.261421 Transcript_116922/m.261421 type:complete len:548 (-) Transcript_116922:31-1674(-)
MALLPCARSGAGGGRGGGGAADRLRGANASSASSVSMSDRLPHGVSEAAAAAAASAAASAAADAVRAALGKAATSEKGDVPEPSSSIPKDFTRIEAAYSHSRQGPATYSSQADLDGLVRHLEIVDRSYRDLPPVPLDGGPLVVGVRIELIKFQDLEEVAGTVNLVLDMTLCWCDERLSFDSHKVFHTSWDHTGDMLPIMPRLIWTPDIVVLNQVSEMEHMFETEELPAVIADDAFKKETGVNVLWRRRINMKSRCGIDMTRFPFDQQQCSIIIGSWASSRRQMLLVPQGTHQKLDFGGSIHTSEFRVLNITVVKKDVYMRNAAERFEEIQYVLTLERYAHFYIVNFILPMMAVTMLTVATMWMTSPGTRMNSGTRLLLCIVQIMNITASWRPANERDIWLDRFQSHCLALSMAAVLQSLVMDYLLKTGVFELQWAPRSHVIDVSLRTMICLTTISIFMSDFCYLLRVSDAGGLYRSFHGHSSKLLLAFAGLIFMCLGTSSVMSTLWLILPPALWKRMCCKGCSSVVSGGHGDMSPATSERQHPMEDT